MDEKTMVNDILNSTKADLPIGAISPHNMLAVRAKRCPCVFLFTTLFG